MVKKLTSIILTLAIVVSSVNLIGTKQVKAAPANDIAYGKRVTCSSFSGTNFSSNIVDGNTETKWVSTNSSNQWITIDLGAVYYLTSIKIFWGNTPSKYTIYYGTSDGVFNSSDTYANSGTGMSIKTHPVSNKPTRYIKVQRADGQTSGMAMYDFAAYGSLAPGQSDPSVYVSGKTPTDISQGFSGTASSSDINYPVENIFDGDSATKWWSGEADNASVSVDLGGHFVVESFWLTWGEDYPKGYTVEYSTDGVRWMTVGTYGVSGPGRSSGYVGNKVMRYIKITANTSETQNGFSIYDMGIKGY